MQPFNAGTFSDVANTDFGNAIWKFLHSKEAIACMDTTSYLQRPALEGLQPLLLAEFGDDLRVDRIKQMLGRMVRQIMESRGYQLDQTNVRTRAGDLFTSAARYKKPTNA